MRVAYRSRPASPDERRRGAFRLWILRALTRPRTVRPPRMSRAAPQAGAIRAGLFEAPAEGVAKVALIMPPRGEEIIASAVTLEPANGTDEPTGTMYLKGDLPPR